MDEKCDACSCLNHVLPPTLDYGGDGVLKNAVNTKRSTQFLGRAFSCDLIFSSGSKFCFHFTKFTADSFLFTLARERTDENDGKHT